MGKRLSKKESWFKKNNFTAADEIYVGIDVHKRHYHIAIWHNGRIGCLYSMSANNYKVLRDIEQLHSSLKNIVYEAGPTGYSLVRLLRSANLPAEVAAVSKTPRMTDTSAKTDRLDCQQLVEYAAIRIFKSHPGVGNIVAWAFRAEMFNITRFNKPKQISKYTGLCPRISQSGQTSRQGPITKTGRRQLRAMLIQAAWVWYRRDPNARQIYNRLLQNTGNGKKAIVGLAKRIAIHLWRMLCDGCLYDANLVKA